MIEPVHNNLHNIFFHAFSNSSWFIYYTDNHTKKVSLCSVKNTLKLVVEILLKIEILFHHLHSWLLCSPLRVSGAAAHDR